MLQYGNLVFPVAIGRGGVRSVKREGDGATPSGHWRVREIFYRPDRIRRPFAKMSLKAIRPSDGWCDAMHDRNYNRKVKLPYPASHERLWRNDNLYDLVVVLDYNIAPRVKGLGSAIFMHVARRGLAPTEGCIAMKREHLLRLIAQMPSEAAVSVGKSEPIRQRGRRGLR
jgi:L,D-peptidoglycan transpeptidase YkuD (ErfK/YbiS/YcfS/YnhG family)